MDNIDTFCKIIGIGIDLVEIERIKSAILKHGKNFTERIFTEKEIEYCEKYDNKWARFAAKFSAKEAVGKAFGTGLGKDIAFKDIEIVNEKNGKPRVNLSDNCRKRFDNAENIDIHISISHSREFATAMVVVTEKSNTNS